MLDLYKNQEIHPGGGTNPKETDHCSWGRVHQCLSEAELSLLVNRGADWADTSTHKPTHQSTEHPGESTRVEERERVQFPIKFVEYQLWIWFDHLLQSRICQIQSICIRSDWFQSNRLRIHWFIDFRFAPLFINLLIKIINNWFLGLSDLSDGKSLKTRK